MDAGVSARSAAIRLSDVVVHAPPLVASEVHTSLGNIELSRKYGMLPHLCQHDGKLCVSRLVRCRDSIGTFPFVTLHIQAGMTLMGLIMVWQKYDHEIAGSTVPPKIARAIRGC